MAVKDAVKPLRQHMQQEAPDAPAASAGLRLNRFIPRPKIGAGWINIVVSWPIGLNSWAAALSQDLRGRGLKGED